MVQGSRKTKTAAGETTQPYVIIRTASAGTFAGELVRRDGSEVTLNNARRLWRRAGTATLSQLAITGPMRPADCKMPAPVNGNTILGVIEIIPCTPVAKMALEAVPIWAIG